MQIKELFLGIIIINFCTSATVLCDRAIDNIVPVANSSEKQFLANELVLETKKWQYVNDFFTHELKVSTGLKNKIGSVIANYSWLAIVPAAAMLGTISGFKYIELIEKILHKNFGDLAIAASIGTFSIATFFLANFIVKRFGNFIEDKPSQCRAIVTNFIQNFDQHKEQMPKVLRGLFEYLQAKKVIMTAEQTKKLVECILIMSSTFELLQ